MGGLSGMPITELSLDGMFTGTMFDELPLPPDTQQVHESALPFRQQHVHARLCYCTLSEDVWLPCQRS